MIRKIAVTGTKGKTTAVYFIDALLRGLQKHTLRVDTTGHYVDGAQKSTLESSKDIWGLVPSVAPGRYLYEFISNPLLQDREQSVAVLECSLGSSTPSGVAYGIHDVGVFLNVYEDHLGSSSRLKTKEDILDAKQFVFNRIKREGWAVFNADDALVVKGLGRISPHLNVKPIAFGLALSELPHGHLENGGRIVTVENANIVYKIGDTTQVIASVDDLPWTFRGAFKPSVYNAMAAVAAVIGLYEGSVPEDLGKVLAGIRLDPNQGRLVLYKNAAGVTVLADYAHEKVSLKEVAALGHTLANEDGKVIGVVRLAYDRTDQLITETGHEIAEAFDSFIVYDKIDGYWRQPREDLHNAKFQMQKTGHVSSVFAEALKSRNPHVEQILREDEAIARAAAVAKAGDVVVVIVNDDIGRSLEFIQDKFKAELV